MPAGLSSERDRETLRSFAHRIDAGDAGAHNNLGVLYFKKGMTAEAVAEFTRALELDSRMTIAHAVRRFSSSVKPASSRMPSS